MKLKFTPKLGNPKKFKKKSKKNFCTQIFLNFKNCFTYQYKATVQKSSHQHKTTKVIQY